MGRMRWIAAGLLLTLVPAISQGEGWVAFLHTPPAAQHAEVDMQLVGAVIGLRPGETLILKYRGEGQAWKETPIRAGWGDEYAAVIPSKDLDPPWVEYYVLLHGDAKEVAIFAAESAPKRITVVTEARMQDGAERPTGPTLEELRAAGRKELSAFAREAPVTSATLRAQSVTRAPAIVSTISRKQMEAMGARRLVDVLGRIPGFVVSRDVQGFYRLAVRGLRSDPEILFLYDGQRLGNLYDGRNLYELPIAGLSRVEVIRGPGAALFGAGAFLAVINVVSSDTLGLDVQSAMDSFAVGHTHLELGIPVGKQGSIHLGANLESGRGYHAQVTEDAFGGSASTPAGSLDDHHRLATASIRGHHPLSKGESLDWSLRGISQQRGALIGAFDSLGPNSSLGWAIGLLHLEYGRMLAQNARLRLELLGDFQSVKRSFELAPAGYQSGGYTFENGVFEEQRHFSDAVTLRGTAEFELLEGNTLSLLISGGREGLDGWGYGVNFDPATGAPLESVQEQASVGVAAADPGLAHRLALGLMLQDFWKITEGLELTAGVRGDLFVGGVGRKDALEVGEAGTAFATSPRIGLVWQPSDPWTFKGLFATAFRVPTFEELSATLVQSNLTQGRFEGSPTLEPVRIRTAELSAENRMVSGSHQIRLRANLFYNSFLGRIDAVDETGVITALSNRGGAINVYGAEGGGRVDFSPRDGLRVDLAWFRAVDSQAPAGRNLLTDTPQLSLIVQTEVALGPLLDLHLDMRLGSERRNNARSTLEALRRFRIPPYALMTVTLQTRPLAGHLVVGLTLRNLLDSTLLDDVPRPDRVTALLPREGLSAELQVRGHF